MKKLIIIAVIVCIAYYFLKNKPTTAVPAVSENEPIADDYPKSGLYSDLGKAYSSTGSGSNIVSDSVPGSGSGSSIISNSVPGSGSNSSNPGTSESSGTAATPSPGKESAAAAGSLATFNNITKSKSAFL